MANNEYQKSLENLIEAIPNAYAFRKDIEKMQKLIQVETLFEMEISTGKELIAEYKENEKVLVEDNLFMAKQIKELQKKNEKLINAIKILKSRGLGVQVLTDTEVETGKKHESFWICDSCNVYLELTREEYNELVEVFYNVVE